MDFLNSLDPPPERALAMGLDDSEEEIECSGNSYTQQEEGGEEGKEEEAEQDDDQEPVDELQMITAGSVNLPRPPGFIPFKHTAPEHGRHVHLPT